MKKSISAKTPLPYHTLYPVSPFGCTPQKPPGVPRDVFRQIFNLIRHLFLLTIIMIIIIIVTVISLPSPPDITLLPYQSASCRHCHHYPNHCHLLLQHKETSLSVGHESRHGIVKCRVINNNQIKKEKRKEKLGKSKSQGEIQEPHVCVSPIGAPTHYSRI